LQFLGISVSHRQTRAFDAEVEGVICNGYGDSAANRFFRSA
jgi:hypothetical protein